MQATHPPSLSAHFHPCHSTFARFSGSSHCRHRTAATVREGATKKRRRWRRDDDEEEKGNGATKRVKKKLVAYMQHENDYIGNAIKRRFTPFPSIDDAPLPFLSSAADVVDVVLFKKGTGSTKMERMGETEEDHVDDDNDDFPGERKIDGPKGMAKAFRRCKRRGKKGLGIDDVILSFFLFFGKVFLTLADDDCTQHRRRRPLHSILLLLFPAADLVFYG